MWSNRYRLAGGLIQMKKIAAMAGTLLHNSTTDGSLGPVAEMAAVHCATIKFSNFRAPSYGCIQRYSIMTDN